MKFYDSGSRYRPVHVGFVSASRTGFSLRDSISPLTVTPPLLRTRVFITSVLKFVDSFVTQHT